MIAEVKDLKTQFGEQIKAFLAEKKESEVQTKQAQYDELKEKWKKLPKDLRI